MTEPHPVVPAASAGAGHLLPRIRSGLSDLFRTRRPVLVAASPAVVLLEAVARCGISERVLVVVGGRDGERFASVAEGCGKEVIRAYVPEGATLEPRHLACFLDGPAVDAVALVHAESSTGALAPLEELGAVVRSRSGMMLLVDATSSAGAEPIEPDVWGLDAVVAGSAGPLGLPPGLAFGALSERLLARARTLPARGWALDLVRLDEAARSDVAPEDLPLPFLRALALGLDQLAAAGGLPAARRRRAGLHAALERWLERNPGWSPLARERRRSAAVVVLQRDGERASRAGLHLPADLTEESLEVMLAPLEHGAESTPAV